MSASPFAHGKLADRERLLGAFVTAVLYQQPVVALAAVAVDRDGLGAEAPAFQVGLLDLLHPNDEPGRLTLIHRFGAKHIDAELHG